VSSDPCSFRKWNTWIGGVKAEVMVWDGKSTEALRLFTGAEFRRVRGEDGVAMLGRSSFSADRYVRPGDLVVAPANTSGPVIVVPADVTWLREALGDREVPG
jgi:hypothetical protein